MEISLSREVMDLFSRYEKYSQEFDFRRVAKLYGGRLVAASPGKITFHNNNIITRWRFDQSMKSFYNKAGLIATRIIDMQEIKISDQFSLVKVSWAATFKKTHDQPLTFHISYLVRKRKSKAEIVLSISHEDEAMILQGYGIIS